MPDTVPEQATWAFNTSSCRNDAFQPFRMGHGSTTLAPPRSYTHSYTSAPPPIRIGQGMLLLDDDLVYTAEWPPVQQFLADARRNKRLPEGASDIVLALAALEVLDNPYSPVHWLLWDMSVYPATAKVVDKIALAQPKMIKSRIPWTGEFMYKNIVASYQEKFIYIEVRKEWYPTESNTGGMSFNSKKRNLRSANSGPTVQTHFNFPEREPPTAKRRKRNSKDDSQAGPTSPVERPRRSKPAKPPLSLTGPQADHSASPDEPSSSPVEPCASNSRHPLGASPEPAGIDPTLALHNGLSPRRERLSPADASNSRPPSPDPDSLSTSHSRNRSISQASAETLVDEDSEDGPRRSTSVETSVDAPSSSLVSKKGNNGLGKQAMGDDDQATFGDTRRRGKRRSRDTQDDLGNESSASIAGSPAPSQDSIPQGKRRTLPRTGRTRV